MHRIYLSLIGPLLALVIGGSLKAEILVGIADTFSGPTGYGFEMQRSAELAVAELNAAGGVLGETVRLIAVDDACDHDQAVAAAHKLVEAGVVLVVGTRAHIPRSRLPRSTRPRAFST